MKDSQKKTKKKIKQKFDSLPDNKYVSKISKSYNSINLYHLLIAVILLNCFAALFVYIYFNQIKKLVIPDNSSQELIVKPVPNVSDIKNSINATAEAYVVYDPISRTIVTGKNQNLRLSPASTAKIMTAVLALEHYDLNEYLTVPDVSRVQGSKMDLVSGEKLRVIDLLYGLLLPSGNDAAYTLAYYYPGGVEGFVKKMNDKASELRLLNTYFVDPAGYEDANYSTAIEMARLGAYAMQNQTFAQIVKTRATTVYDMSGEHAYNLKNLNELLAYPSVLGIKTGFTNEAGGVLVTAIYHNGRILIVVVLKSQDRFYDTDDLIKFINEKVTYSLP